MHPLLALVVGGVLTAYGIVLWIAERRFPSRWVIGGLPIVLSAGAMDVYLLLAFRTDPVLSSWGQAVMLSPPPQYFLSGYGLLTPLALAGAADLCRRRERPGIFLVSWVVTVFLLAYTPFNMQRRLVEGVHVPISLLAAVGLHRCVLPALARSPLVRAVARLGYPRRRTIWLMRSLLIALTWLSNLYLVGSASLAGWARSPALFHSADRLAAFGWLRNNLAYDDTLLASYETGNLIPAWAGRRVFVGHWAESVDWPEREAQVEKFFDVATPDGWRIALLRQYDITHVFYGLQEKALGEFDLTTADYLREVHAVGEVTVYEVVRP